MVIIVPQVAYSNSTSEVTISLEVIVPSVIRSVCIPFMEHINVLLTDIRERAGRSPPMLELQTRLA